MHSPCQLTSIKARQASRLRLEQYEPSARTALGRTELKAASSRRTTMSDVKQAERVKRCFSFYYWPCSLVFAFWINRALETFPWLASERPALLHLLSVRGPVVGRHLLTLPVTPGNERAPSPKRAVTNPSAAAGARRFKSARSVLIEVQNLRRLKRV